MNSNTVYKAFSSTCEEFGNHPFLHIPDTAAPYNTGSIDASYQKTLEEIDSLASNYDITAIVDDSSLGIAELYANSLHIDSLLLANLTFISDCLILSASNAWIGIP